MNTFTRSFIGQTTQLNELFEKIRQLHETALSEDVKSAELAKRLLPALLEQYEICRGRSLSSPKAFVSDKIAQNR